MKHLQIPYVFVVEDDHTIDHISKRLDRLKKTAIEKSPWGEYSHQSKVNFATA